MPGHTKDDHKNGAICVPAVWGLEKIGNSCNRMVLYPGDEFSSSATWDAIKST